MKPKLDSQKVRDILDKDNRNLSWLAREARKSRALVSYWLKTDSLSGVHDIAKVFKISYKNLIK